MRELYLKNKALRGDRKSMLSLKKSNPSDWLISQNKYQSKKTSLKAKTISVTAGKGGVGKTSVAVKMGKLLAESGYKVLLLDCDTNLSNTVVKLGLPISNYFYELISAQKNLMIVYIKTATFICFLVAMEALIFLIRI